MQLVKTRMFINLLEDQILPVGLPALERLDWAFEFQGALRDAEFASSPA